MAKDAADKQNAQPEGEKTVFCVRNQVHKPVSEHLGCPYCFGKTRAVVDRGEHQQFCDFDPDKDPTSFGFPENSTRNLKG